MLYSDLRSFLTIYQLSATDYQESLAEQVEGILFVNSIQKLIEGHADDEILKEEALNKLKALLAKRFNNIRYTYLLYTRNTASRVNQLCMHIAEALQHIEGFGNRFQLMMPSIKSTVSDITLTDLNNLNIKLTDFILSRQQGSFIEVEDALTTAEVDGEFNHTQRLSKEGKRIRLAAIEKSRLRYHTQQSGQYHDAIMAHHGFLRGDKTLGLALKELIEGLRNGGENQEGEDENAGNSANVAIARFGDIYNNQLTNYQRRWLNGLQTGGGVKFKPLWEIISIKQHAKIARILTKTDISDKRRKDLLEWVHGATETCVELNADAIEAVLKHNKNRLYSEFIKFEVQRSFFERIRRGVTQFSQIRDHSRIHNDLANQMKHAKDEFVAKMQELRDGKINLKPQLTEQARNKLEIQVAKYLSKLDDQTFESILPILAEVTLFGTQDELSRIVERLTENRRIHFGACMEKVLNEYPAPPPPVNHENDDINDSEDGYYYYSYYSSDSDSVSFEYDYDLDDDSDEYEYESHHRRRVGRPSNAHRHHSSNVYEYDDSDDDDRLPHRRVVSTSNTHRLFSSSNHHQRHAHHQQVQSQPTSAPHHGHFSNHRSQHGHASHDPGHTQSSSRSGRRGR